jgi:hypothetical protein
VSQLLEKSPSVDVRYEFLDFVRGIAIIVMIFFHSFTYFEGDLNQFADAAADNPIAIGIKFFGRFAGIFALVSGASNSIMFMRRYSAGYAPRKILFGMIIYGSCIALFGIIAVIFFERAQTGGGIYDFEEGPTYYAILTGLFETGKLHLPSPFMLFFNIGPLGMLAEATITTGIVMYLMLRNNPKPDIDQILMTLGLVGTILVLISPFMNTWLHPIYITAIENGEIVKAMLLTNFVGEKQPFFPFGGYSLYGAMFGLALISNISRKKVCRIALLGAFFYIFAGSIAYSLFGEPPVKDTYRPPAGQMIILQIGIMIVIMTIFYYMQLNPDTSISKKIVKNITIRRFGICTLTIYIYEAFVGAGIKSLILDRIFPGWATNMGWVVIYAVALVFFWGLIIRLWEANGFKGSFEWFLYLMTARFRPGAGSRFKAIKLNDRELQEEKSI